MSDACRLRWERGTRYYEVHLARDLFGDWVLTRVWGQRNSPLGKVLHTPCISHDDARISLSKIATRRRAHGYTPI